MTMFVESAFSVDSIACPSPVYRRPKHGPPDFSGAHVKSSRCLLPTVGVGLPLSRTMLVGGPGRSIRLSLHRKLAYVADSSRWSTSMFLNFVEFSGRPSQGRTYWATTHDSTAEGSGSAFDCAERVTV